MKGSMEPPSLAAPSQAPSSSPMSTTDSAGTTASSTELSTKSRLPRGSASAKPAAMILDESEYRAGGNVGDVSHVGNSRSPRSYLPTSTLAPSSSHRNFSTFCQRAFGTVVDIIAGCTRHPRHPRHNERLSASDGRAQHSLACDQNTRWQGVLPQLHHQRDHLGEAR
jgi:hypothetical protein